MMLDHVAIYVYIVLSRTALDYRHPLLAITCMSLEQCIKYILYDIELYLNTVRPTKRKP